MDYTTQDLGLASFLVASGFSTVEIKHGRKATFIFPASARNRADDYWEETTIKPSLLIATLRELKARLKTELNQY